MRIDDVQRGDIIKGGSGKGIEVTKVELGLLGGACSRTKVHINRKYCWDSGSQVSVTRSSTEAGVSDMEIDEFLLFEDSLFSDKTLLRNLATQGS